MKPAAASLEDRKMRLVQAVAGTRDPRMEAEADVARAKLALLHVAEGPSDRTGPAGVIREHPLAAVSAAAIVGLLLGRARVRFSPLLAAGAGIGIRAAAARLVTKVF